MTSEHDKCYTELVWIIPLLHHLHFNLDNSTVYIFNRFDLNQLRYICSRVVKNGYALASEGGC